MDSGELLSAGFLNGLRRICIVFERSLFSELGFDSPAFIFSRALFVVLCSYPARMMPTRYRVTVIVESELYRSIALASTSATQPHN